MREVVFIVLLFSGMFFLLVGTIGILRLPDVLTRAHSAAKCDTLGAILSLSSLIVLRGIDLVSIKLLTIILFIWITSPTATHLIANAYITKRSRVSGLGCQESNVRSPKLKLDDR